MPVNTRSKNMKNVARCRDSRLHAGKHGIRLLAVSTDCLQLCKIIPQHPHHAYCEMVVLTATSAKVK